MWSIKHYWNTTFFTFFQLMKIKWKLFSFTGAVAFQNVTKAYKAMFCTITKTYLTARKTIQTEVKAGYSDLLLFFGINNTYRLKGTLGITG